MTPIEATPTGVRIRLKVVPGASKTELVGIHGDRLRVRVAAPPEAGKANRAVCALLAERLGVGRRAVRIVQGETSPLKTVEVDNASPTDVEGAL